MAIVEAQDLCKSFGAVKALEGLSFSVEEGEIFGLVGPDGSGKTTCLRILCGLLRPSSGEGRINGLDIVTQAERIKASLGYMSQRFSLYDDLRVEENMRLFGGIYGLDSLRCKKRVEEVLDLISLRKRRMSLAGELPTGLKQRLALGCALLHEPPVIFLDEPTSGVDPGPRRSFWDLIYALADQGATVFVTTHYMEEAEYCNRIGLIDQGRLIALGSPAELKTRHLSGTVFEITAPDVLAAMEALSGAKEVLDAAVFGRALHVRIKEGMGALAYLSPFLASAGLSIENIRPIEPTLEDVFVALVGRKGNA